MIAMRVDDEGFPIVSAVANPQVLLSGPKGTRVVGTLQLLTKGGTFENPLSSERVKGLDGWSGHLVPPFPMVALPGVILPFVAIEPQSVTALMRKRCVEVTLDGRGGATVHAPPDFVPRWRAVGPADGHGYSLRPTLFIEGCHRAVFTPEAVGSLPSRQEEGGIAVFAGETGLRAYGIVVDVDSDVNVGYAVPLDALLALDLHRIGVL